MRITPWVVLVVAGIYANGSFSLADPLPEEHRGGRNEEAAHARVKRAYQSYYYNYLDEMAMSICAAIQQYVGQIYAVRRTPGEASTCKDICTNDELRDQAANEWKSKQWGCSESLHVYKGSKVLAENHDSDTDSHKLGLAVYRYQSCTLAGAGPNYCCCNITDTVY